MEPRMELADGAGGLSQWIDLGMELVDGARVGARDGTRDGAGGCSQGWSWQMELQQNVDTWWLLNQVASAQPSDSSETFPERRHETLAAPETRAGWLWPGGGCRSSPDIGREALPSGEGPGEAAAPAPLPSVVSRGRCSQVKVRGGGGSEEAAPAPALPAAPGGRGPR